MQMFADPNIRGILCFRGGYGSARLLPLLDFDLIRANPKVFVGYSDITSIHCALLAKADLVYFHGPMLNSELLKPNPSPFTQESLFQGCDATGTCRLALRPHGKQEGQDHRRRQGVRSPGWRQFIDSMRVARNPFQPSFKGALLFIEELNEEPYRFDRMLLNFSMRACYSRSQVLPSERTNAVAIPRRADAPSSVKPWKLSS